MTNLKIKTTAEKVITPQAKLIKKQTVSLAGNDKFYATGKRKCSVARVWLKPGKGDVIINKKKADSYFPRGNHIQSIFQPFVITNTTGQYDIICTVKGGGISGQMGAVLHGVSKALNSISPDFHLALRKNGFLTRDSRIVESKKYGKRKARKGTQFSKR